MNKHLLAEGLDVFMASTSLAPGDDWRAKVQENLRNTKCVIFLASSTACQSAYVLQEIGGALLTQKQMIPVVWDMAPYELPGWVDQKQALDLRGLDGMLVNERMLEIAKKIRTDKNKTQLIGAILLAGILYLVSRE